MERVAWFLPGASFLARRMMTNGQLVHHRGHHLAFHNDGAGEDDDEPSFKFNRYGFAPGEHVAISEHDEVQRTFLVTEVIPAD